MDSIAQKLKEYADRRKTERERIMKNVEKEDFLLSQIDEFREKAKQLQGLLATKETKVQELQEIVEEREGKARELSDMIEERKDIADRVVSGVGEKIEGMVDKVDAKLNELNETFAERLAENAVSSTEQSDEVRRLIKEHNAALTETVQGLNGEFEKLKNDVFEKIHSEDVQCYRNIHTLMEQQEQRIETLKDEMAGFRSIQTMLKAVLVFSILSFAGAAGAIAIILNLL